MDELMIAVLRKAECCRYCRAWSRNYTGENYDEYQDTCNVSLGVGDLSGMDIYHEKPDWCPLHPAPEKMGQSFNDSIIKRIRMAGFKRGWNACVDAILKQEETE